jgi:hypothetical protein
MASKLSESLNILRAVAPDLNAASNEANKVVKAVEKVLVDELGVGIWEMSDECSVSAWRVTNDSGDRIEEEIRAHLAFGRVNGSYCIHRNSRIFQKDSEGNFTQLIDCEDTPWSQCDRQTRLELFEWLPGLIENIAAKATEVAKKAQSTAAMVRELIGDDGDSKQADHSSVVRRPGQSMADVLTEATGIPMPEADQDSNLAGMKLPSPFAQRVPKSGGRRKS